MSATAERMTTAEVLRKALELLGANGERWANGPERGEKFCAGLALGEVCGTTAFFSCPGYRYLLKAAGIEEEALGRWNDAPERTWPEVKAAFEKAIELAEASR